MKITVDVDEELFTEVMDITGAPNESEAIRAALEDLASKDWMKGLFIWPRPTREEFGNAIPDDYDPKSIWQRDAAAPVTHEETPSSRQ